MKLSKMAAPEFVIFTIFRDWDAVRIQFGWAESGGGGGGGGGGASQYKDVVFPV